MQTKKLHPISEVIHNTALIDLVNSSGELFYLSLGYSSLDVEARTETLVYDVGNFLAAAGGNLGLFFGFICLSCIWSFISITEQYFCHE